MGSIKSNFGCREAETIKKYTEDIMPRLETKTKNTPLRGRSSSVQAAVCYGIEVKVKYVDDYWNSTSANRLDTFKEALKARKLFEDDFPAETFRIVRKSFVVVG